MESVRNYQQLHASLDKEIGLSELDFLKILLQRASLLIAHSQDDEAKRCMQVCNLFLQKQPPSPTDLDTAKEMFLNYGDEESLQPPHLDYYYAMPLLLALSVTEFAISESPEVFQHACDQYETMLQVASALLDTRSLYEIDAREVSQHLASGVIDNTTFRQFSELLQDPDWPKAYGER
ncbi:MAG: hypothetical protein BGP04_01900 [Rhizobiales bacterium 62-17]|nr:hypothetical protein [Hyphomicrobiales bacterium]OJY04196.1 MAG: hypothetical protein BGP04_01900 [Rhizobiales bacterium 62-17]